MTNFRRRGIESLLKVKEILYCKIFNINHIEKNINIDRMKFYHHVFQSFYLI